MSKQLVKNAIDSICLPCARRILHFQLFVMNSNSSDKNYFWIIEYINEKKLKETDAPPIGCGICFGLLEKYSQNAYLTDLADKINASRIQFKDFRISLTAPNVSTLRENFIKLIFQSIPEEDSSIPLYNPSCLTVKEQWKILTFCPLEVIMKKKYNHSGPFDVITKFNIEEGLESDNKLLESRSNPEIIGKPKRLSRKTRIQKEIQENGFTTQNVKQIINEKNLKDLKNFYELPFKRITMQNEVECFHDPIFIAGRYLKYSRTLSQSKWLVEGENKFNINSIEEILNNILQKELGASEVIFAASGREDIDVKCLGKGRPFCLEFIHPRRTDFALSELKKYQKLINASSNELEVRDLQHVQRDQTKLIREGQNDKTKCYSALCYCYSKIEQTDIEKLNSLDQVETFQKTPVRVLHRRTVMTRPRIISEIVTTLIDEHHFRIKMKTQAGAYVKEFVHGDLGRTEPSISTILNKECDILELDVEAVNLDFPPEINHDEVEMSEIKL